MQMLPCPRSLPLLGHLHLFTRWGPYKSLENIILALEDLLQQYGPVVRLRLGVDMVALSQPEDVQTLFRVEGKYPTRPSFLALQKYRRSRPEMYSSTGITTENGPEWYRLRHASNFLLKESFVRKLLPAQWEVAQEVPDLLRRARHRETMVVPDLIAELYRYTLESTGRFCFGRRLGALENLEGGLENPHVAAATTTVEAMAETLLGLPLWRIFPTEPYRNIVKSQDYFYHFTVRTLKENSDNLLAATLFQNPDLDEKDVVLLLIELFFAGIDTTAITLTYFFYHMARNPEVQERLRTEIQAAWGGQPKEGYRPIPYLRACIKESMRITPTATANARFTSQEAEFSGYKVPANTMCIGVNKVLGKIHFPEPDKFIPERWLQDDRSKRPHPYLVLPFGHGPRHCVGERLAEQEMYTCIVKVLENFRLSYEGLPIGTVSRLQMVPDRKVAIQVEDI